MDDKQIFEITKVHNLKINYLNSQRQYWLYASSVAVSGIILLMVFWDFLDGMRSTTIWWIIVSIMLIVSINWWYWTIKLIRILIDQRKDEIKIINELVIDIKLIKSSISELNKELKNLSK